MKLKTSLAKAVFGIIIIGLGLWSGLALIQDFATDRNDPERSERSERSQPQQIFEADNASTACQNQVRISAEEAVTITSKAVLDAVVVRVSTVDRDDRFIYALEMNNGAEVAVDACSGDILAIKPARKPQNQVVDTVPSLILD